MCTYCLVKTSSWRVCFTIAVLILLTCKPQPYSLPFSLCLPSNLFATYECMWVGTQWRKLLPPSKYTFLIMISALQQMCCCHLLLHGSCVDFAEETEFWLELPALCDHDMCIRKASCKQCFKEIIMAELEFKTSIICQ